MFTHLSNTAKAFLFFGIAFGLTLTASLLYPLLGEVTPFIHTYTPTLSVLIMMLVVTRDGYSKTGWATSACITWVCVTGRWHSWDHWSNGRGYGLADLEWGNSSCRKGSRCP